MTNYEYGRRDEDGTVVHYESSEDARTGQRSWGGEAVRRVVGEWEPLPPELPTEPGSVVHSSSGSRWQLRHDYRWASLRDGSILDANALAHAGSFTVLFDAGKIW
ncbi:MAG: hypothetical protein JWO98_5309 [Frankiales bacterium]|nr:hypothetical protein [Frankiales bacterium]